MGDFGSMLVQIVAAEDPNTAVSAALDAWVSLVRPQVACMLLWDEVLQRYIIGEFRSGEWPAQELGSLRRTMLRWGMDAYHHDPSTAQVLSPCGYYQPLNLPHEHIGAFVCRGGTLPSRQGEDYAALIIVSARSIFNARRLDQARRDQAALEAERERLEHLLRAVEDQQRAIDRLLLAERQLSASLDVKINQRTEALRQAQAQLIQSEKLAVIGHLASSLAHEINNPLQAVQSGLGLILDELGQYASPEVCSDLLVIQAELERISKLFRQMLDLYRPSSFDRHPLSLNVICESAHVLTRKRLEEGNISVEMHLIADLPLVCGNENQIMQVVLNLMLNAAEAMSERGGMLRLYTFVAGQDVCIRVEDNGPGIAPEHRARLFEPLFTTKVHGLGLGLAISHEIIQQHNGTIKVADIEGGGAAFTVCLPTRENGDEISTNSGCR